MQRFYLIAGAVCCFLSVCALFLYKCLFFNVLSYIIIAVIDLFLIGLLICSAKLSDNHDKRETTEIKTCNTRLEDLLPTRTWGLLLFAFILISIVCSFASLYLDQGAFFQDNITSIHDALYFSFGVLTTVNFGDFRPCSNWTMTLTMLEVLSSVILFFGAFALLVSRLATFSTAEEQGAEKKISLSKKQLNELAEEIAKRNKA